MDSFLKTQEAAFMGGRFFLPLARFFFALFWLTFPFQVRSLLFDLPLYETGTFNPYTTFFLSLSDILLVLTACFFGVALVRKEVGLRIADGVARWFFWLLLAFAASLLLTALWAAQPLLVLFSSLRFFEGTLLVWLLIQEVLPVSRVRVFFLGGLFFQAALAVGQTVWQGSLFRGGVLDRLGALLGEPLLGAAVPGAAKVDVGGAAVVRAYGTFPHSNVLAGALGMSLFIFPEALRSFDGNFLGKMAPGFQTTVDSKGNRQRKEQRGRKWRFFLVALFMLAFIFTFSRSALLGLLLGFFWVLLFSGLLLRHWKRFLLLFGVAAVFLVGTFFASDVFRERFTQINDPASLVQRVMYLGAAGDMFLAHPFGLGLSHFTLALPDFAQSSLPPWEFQPVHNAYVLAFAEGGILSGVLFLSLWLFIFVMLLVRLFFNFSLKALFSLNGVNRSAEKIWQKDRFWAASLLGLGTFLMIVSLFDHYLFTLPQGQVLLYLYFGLVMVFLL